MKIVIAGGTGLIGRALASALLRSGHVVHVLSRRPTEHRDRLPTGVSLLSWDGAHTGPWEETVASADGIVNLAGAPIADRRWTASRKQELLMTRLHTTRLIVDALSRPAYRERVLINASGIGYYGPGEQAVTEASPAGSDFMADLAASWERQAERAEMFGVRVIRLRTGMVLAREGGALPRLAMPFRLYLGGSVQPGTQWVSWIHIGDVVALIIYALEHREIRGPVNAVAPGAVRMNDFCRTLGSVLGRPCWLPVPGLALRLALGELSIVMLTGQRAAPEAAMQAGYRFRYPELRGALEDLYTGGPAAHE